MEFPTTKKQTVRTHSEVVSIDYIEVGPLKKKIIDFSNIKRHGIIEVRPINPKKFEQVSFSSFPLGRTGIRWGYPEEINFHSGEIKWRKFNFVGTTFFDLQDEEDAKVWHVLQYHHSVQGNPFLFNGVPLLRVHDKEEIAKNEIKKARKANRALTVAFEFESDYVAMADFARMVGISPERNSPEVVYSMILEKAKNDPEYFLNQYDNPNRVAMEVFKRGLTAGIIKQNNLSGYMFGDSYPLGASESAALGALIAKRDILFAIDQQSKEKLKTLLFEYNINSPKDSPSKLISFQEDMEKKIVNNSNATPKGDPFSKPVEEVRKTHTPTPTPLAQTPPPAPVVHPTPEPQDNAQVPEFNPMEDGFGNEHDFNKDFENTDLLPNKVRVAETPSNLSLDLNADDWGNDDFPQEGSQLTPEVTTNPVVENKGPNVNPPKSSKPKTTNNRKQS